MARTPGLGIEYEVLLPAYFALQLNTNPNIQTFAIESNVTHLANFDDLLVSIKLQNGDEKKFAFQLKHSANNSKNILPTSFEQNKYFSLKRYLDGFNSIDERDQYQLILFTNRNFDPDKTDDVMKEFEMVPNHHCLGCEFFETSTNHSNVYCFKTQANSEYEEFFRQFSLYVGQKNSKCLEDGVIGFFKTNYDCHEFVANNYINFFRRWHKKEFSNGVLTKDDIALQLVDLLVSPFVRIPDLQKLDHSKWNVLYEIGQQFNVIFSQQLENLPPLQFVEEENEILRRAKRNKLITKFAKDLTIETQVKILGFLYQHPLIIKFREDNRNSVVAAMELCAKMNFDIKFLLISRWFESPYGTVFQNLNDLFIVNQSSYETVVNRLEITLLDEEKVSLRELIDEDEEVRKSINLQQLLAIADNRFDCGTAEEHLPKYYVTRTVAKTALDIETVNSLPNESFIIDCDGFYGEIASSIDRDFVDFADLDEHSQLLVLNESETSEEQFNEFCRKTKNVNVHHLRALNADNFEWLGTTGNISELRSCHLKKIYLNEADIHLRNGINLFCAKPGVGKSVLLKHVKNNCSGQFWTVLIDLKQHNSFFSEDHSFEEMLNYFMELPDQSLLTKVKTFYLKKKKVCFFLDGLDELQELCIERAILFAKHLLFRCFRVCISSRNHLNDFLQTQFNSFPIDINGFTVEEQKGYIRDRLENNYTSEEIDGIVDRIVSNETLGAPLQLFMVTHMLLEDPSFRFNSSFLIPTRLYDAFFKAKHKHYVDKIKCQHPHLFENDLKIRLQNYKIAALQVCLGQHHFESLSLNCDDFLESIAKEGDPMGVIIAVNDGRAVFDYFSHAEYLAAAWLADNCLTVPQIKDFIFETKYDSIRFMFDVKLAEELPTHLAVIFGDFNALASQQDQLLLKDQGGRTVLHIACCYGQKFSADCKKHFDNSATKMREHRSILSLLLNSGCDPLTTDQLFGWDAFVYADRCLNLFAINEMLKFAKPDLESFQNYRDVSTLLAHSAEFGFSKILDWTKEKFYFDNTRNSYFLGIVDTVYCHLEFRKSINLKTAQEESLLHLSIKNDHADVVKLLLERGIKVNATDRTNRTPLHLAAIKGDIDVATLLLKHGADVRAVDHRGVNPLRLAISEGHFDIIELLLDYGAFIDEVSSPLQLATIKGHGNVVVLLIENDIDVNAKDEMGRTAFYWSITEDRMNIAILLLSRGADIDASDNSGNAPLHWACQKGDSRRVKYLLDFGAHVNIANNNGSTPLHLAVIKNCVDTVELLLKRGASIDAIDKYYERTPLHFAVYEGHFEVINILLEQGANINITDVDQSSVLHLAVLQGYLDAVKLFLDKGIDVNAKTTSGSTPLHIAAEKNHCDIAKLLVDAGADVDAVDVFKGRRPLHLAAMKGSTKVVELLLNAGCDVDAIDNDQQSCFRLAVRNERFDIVKLLLAKGVDVE